MFLAANIQMRSTTNQDEKLETVGKVYWRGHQKQVLHWS